MTPREAWGIISRALIELYDRRAAEGLEPYKDKEMQAEVVCFMALKEMEERAKNGRC